MQLARPDSLPPAITAFITEERCKRTLQELLRVPSPQTALLEDEPQLKAFIRDAIEPRLRAMGMGAIRYDGMGNLVAETGAGTSGRSLMLIGNAMNQPPTTMPNPYSGDVADGAPYDLPGEVVFGRGASEQKAVLAAMLVALEALLRADVALSGRLIFVCCLSGESGKHDAIRSVVEEAGVRADIAILGGQSLLLSLGNRGRIDVHLTVHGKPAHSSKPQEGCDAITGAARLIDILRQGVGLKVHPDLGPATMAVTRLRSFPESTHTIQARAELTLDRRLLPGEDPDAAFAEIAAIAARLETMTDPASGLAWRVEAELGPFMYPSQISPDGKAARLITDSMLDVVGEAPKPYFTTAAFDQGYLNHVGIECVNFGPGEYRFAHTDLDLASVTRTCQAALIYSRAVLRYLANPA